MSFGHWPAILGSAAFAWVLGALWYSPPLFARAWVRAHGYTPEQLKGMQARAPRTYAMSFVAFILVAFVLHLILHHLGESTFRGGVMWGFHIWLGFALPIGFMANIYSDKPLSAFFIDTTYQLIYLTLMGGILAQWS